MVKSLGFVAVRQAAGQMRRFSVCAELCTIFEKMHGKWKERFTGPGSPGDGFCGASGVVDTSEPVGKRVTPGFKRSRTRDWPTAHVGRSALQVGTRGRGFWAARRLCGCGERAKMSESVELVRRVAGQFGKYKEQNVGWTRGCSYFSVSGSQGGLLVGRAVIDRNRSPVNEGTSPTSRLCGQVGRRASTQVNGHRRSICFNSDPIWRKSSRSGRSLMYRSIPAPLCSAVAARLMNS